MADKKLTPKQGAIIRWLLADQARAIVIVGKKFRLETRIGRYSREIHPAIVTSLVKKGLIRFYDTGWFADGKQRWLLMEKAVQL